MSSLSFTKGPPLRILQVEAAFNTQFSRILSEYKLNIGTHNYQAFDS